MHWLCTSSFSTLGILAEHGGDILSQQAEVPFFYPCGVGPLHFFRPCCFSVVLPLRVSVMSLT